MERNLNKRTIENFYRTSLGKKPEIMVKVRGLLDKYSKPEIEKIMQRIGLPIFKSIRLDREEFLNNPANYFDQLPSSLYFVESRSSLSGERARNFNLDSQQTLDFVNSHEWFDMVTLKENYKNIYSGNIVVSDNKKCVYMAMIEGDLTELLHDGRLDFTACRDDFTNGFKYSFDDQEVRKLMVKILNYIPSSNLTHEPLEYKREFLPGYYEFIVVDKEDGRGLRPIFHDYNLNPAFTNVFQANGLSECNNE